jgi:hypothetical protein
LRRPRSLALARGFIEENAGGDGGVEALNRAGAGDGDGGIGLGGEIRREAATFVADEQGRGAGEIGERGGLRVARRGGEDLYARGAETTETISGSGGEHGNAEDAAGRGADGLGVPGTDGAGEDEDAGDAEGFSGAKNGAEIAGVLEAGEEKQQRRGAEERRPGERGRVDERGDRLRSFSGEGQVEELARQEQDFGFCGEREGVEQALGALRGKDAFDAEAGAEGFSQQVGAFDSDQGVRTGEGVGTAENTRLGGRCARRIGEGAAQFLEASVLRTLYNAKRHRLKTFECTGFSADAGDAAARAQDAENCF